MTKPQKPNLHRLPADYAEALGHVTFAAEQLMSKLENTVNGLIGRAARVVVLGQSADVLLKWAHEIAARELGSEWTAKLKPIASEIRRVLDQRSQHVHAAWRLGDDDQMITMRSGRSKFRQQETSVAALRRLEIDIRNVDVDLWTWAINWQMQRDGRPQRPPRVGDVNEDGSWSTGGIIWISEPNT